MRTLFYEFPDDSKCWKIEDEYLYGADILVAPVLAAGITRKNIYLPEGCSWTEYETQKQYEGGQWIEVEVALDRIPVFERNNCNILA